MNTTKTNNLSFYNEQGTLTLNAKQFDTGRRFVFHIMDNDEPFNLSGCTAYLRIAKADGTQFQGHECCSVDTSHIIVDTSIGNGSQILTSAGINICELHLEDVNGISLTTWNFNILVEPRVHDGSHISSVDSYDVLDIAKRNEEARQKNEEIRLENETQRQENEIQRQENEIQRQENEKNRKNKFEIFESKIGEITDEAKSYAAQAQSWTVGGTNTRTGEDTDNSKHYYEQIKSIAESFSGTLRPKGTIAFSSLPSLSSAKEGDMYNISNQFTTNTDFKEGSGHTIPAGSNIYKTADGKWDVLAGTPVTGIKGDKENTYRRGNVNITPQNIGALSSTGGDIKGNFTVYADGSSPDPDLKVRDGRVDILKTDADTTTGTAASSVAIFEKSRIEFLAENTRIKTGSGKNAIQILKSANDTMDFVNIGNADSQSALQGKGTFIYGEKITIKNNYGITDLSFGDEADIFVGETLTISTDDNKGRRAVIMADTDKLQIGTTDLDQHTYDIIKDKSNTGAHPSIGMRIEQDSPKFTFYSEPSGIEFDLEDLVGNRWYNTLNGTYKFVPIGNKFTSNNKGVHSSTAQSTWQGIFKQNTNFTLKYKVSSESNFDKLTVTLDGVTIINAISGNGTEQMYTTTLKAGKHILYAKYQKDSSSNAYEDRAYLQFDNVVLSLDEIQFDVQPVSDSPYPITSGGLYAAIENIGGPEITDDEITKIINGTYTE